MSAGVPIGFADEMPTEVAATAPGGGAPPPRAPYPRSNIFLLLGSIILFATALVLVWKIFGIGVAFWALLIVGSIIVFVIYSEYRGVRHEESRVGIVKRGWSNFGWALVFFALAVLTAGGGFYGIHPGFYVAAGVFVLFGLIALFRKSLSRAGAAEAKAEKQYKKAQIRKDEMAMLKAEGKRARAAGQAKFSKGVHKHFGIGRLIVFLLLVAGIYFGETMGGFFVVVFVSIAALIFGLAFIFRKGFFPKIIGILGLFLALGGFTDFIGVVAPQVVVIFFETLFGPEYPGRYLFAFVVLFYLFFRGKDWAKQKEEGVEYHDVGGAAGKAAKGAAGLAGKGGAAAAPHVWTGTKIFFKLIFLILLGAGLFAGEFLGGNTGLLVVSVLILLFGVLFFFRRNFVGVFVGLLALVLGVGGISEGIYKAPIPLLEAASPWRYGLLAVVLFYLVFGSRKQSVEA